MSVSEWCPTCGANIVMVTRGIPSMGTCSNGHKTDRRDVLRRPPVDPVATELAVLRTELLQARADAAAAVALMVERAAEQADPWDGPVTKNKIVDAQAIAAQQIKARIRALAPDAGTAELAKLRERAEKAEAQFDRLDAAWASRVAVLQADGDAARKAAADSYASLAQANLRAKNAYMRGLLDSAQHLRSTIPDNPDNWEQVESMARMLDAMATREAARHIAEGQANG